MSLPGNLGQEGVTNHSFTLILSPILSVLKPLFGPQRGFGHIA